MFADINEYYYTLRQEAHNLSKIYKEPIVWLLVIHLVHNVRISILTTVLILLRCVEMYFHTV